MYTLLLKCILVSDWIYLLYFFTFFKDTPFCAVPWKELYRHFISCVSVCGWTCVLHSKRCMCVKLLLFVWTVCKGVCVCDVIAGFINALTATLDLFAS